VTTSFDRTVLHLHFPPEVASLIPLIWGETGDICTERISILASIATERFSELLTCDLFEMIETQEREGISREMIAANVLGELQAFRCSSTVHDLCGQNDATPVKSEAIDLRKIGASFELLDRHEKYLLIPKMPVAGPSFCVGTTDASTVRLLLTCADAVESFARLRQIPTSDRKGPHADQRFLEILSTLDEMDDELRQRLKEIDISKDYQISFVIGPESVHAGGRTRKFTHEIPTSPSGEFRIMSTPSFDIRPTENTPADIALKSPRRLKLSDQERWKRGADDEPWAVPPESQSSARKTITEPSVQFRGYETSYPTPFLRWGVQGLWTWLGRLLRPFGARD
jgi:hypothetical protein